MTGQLLAFSRKGRIQQTTIDLHKVVDEVISILEHTTHRKIAVQKAFDAPVSLTTGDPTQIQNVLLNLAVNAKDAMPSGGTIVFRTRKVRLGADSPPKLSPGFYICLSVTDTGLGMDESTMERIFEPFFTTKERGRGTGIDLAAVYGTMKTHGGDVTVESLVGSGTTFKLYFPLIDTTIEEEIETEAESVRTDGEILVVDDEEMIADAVTAQLSSAGYAVHTFTAGRAALSLYEKNPSSFALVILDIIMPEMDGGRLVSEVEITQPGRSRDRDLGIYCRRRSAGRHG